MYTVESMAQMSYVLTAEQKKQFVQMRAANQRLFVLGISQLVFVLILSLVVWMSESRVDSFMGSGGPWGRPALQSLDAIKPETAREAYILSVFRDVIPLPIVAVKNSFIRSTLLWLLVMSLVVLGFARHQKKNLDFIKGIIKHEDH